MTFSTNSVAVLSFTVFKSKLTEHFTADTVQSSSLNYISVNYRPLPLSAMVPQKLTQPIPEIF